MSRPWALYGWAPLALLGEEINKTGGGNSRRSDGQTSELACVSLIPSAASEPTSVNRRDYEPSADDQEQRAGVYLGIWNIYATVPQFLASFIAMIAFHVLEPGSSLERVLKPVAAEPSGLSWQNTAHRLSGTAVCLVVGALGSVVAATLTFRFRKM